MVPPAVKLIPHGPRPSVIVTLLAQMTWCDSDVPHNHMVNTDYLGWPRAPSSYHTDRFKGLEMTSWELGPRSALSRGTVRPHCKQTHWHLQHSLGVHSRPIYAGHLACANSFNADLHLPATINPAVQLGKAAAHNSASETRSP